jgi:hypothetical protein
MKLKHIAKNLISDHGFTQGSLARELTERGAKCSQTTVWRILQGHETTDTVGNAIRVLHAEKAESTAA